MANVFAWDLRAKLSTHRAEQITAADLSDAMTRPMIAVDAAEIASARSDMMRAAIREYKHYRQDWR